MLVYDVSNRQSFESVSTWMKDIVEVSQSVSYLVVHDSCRN